MSYFFSRKISFATKKGMGVRDRIEALKQMRVERTTSLATTPLPTAAGHCQIASHNPSRKPMTSTSRFSISPTPHVAIALIDPQKDLWAALSKQAVVDYAAEQMTNKMLSRQKQLSQRRALEFQITHAASKKLGDRNSFLNEREVVDLDVVAWEKKQLAADESHKATARRIKRDCDEQVELREERKKQIGSERKRLDGLILAQVEREERDAVNGKVLEKQRQVMYRDEMKKCNDKFIVERAERKKQDAEEELRIARYHAEQVARKELHSAQALDAKKRRAQGQEAMSSQMEASYEEQSKRDEQRLQLEEVKKCKKENDEQLRRDESRRQFHKLIYDTQLKQVQEKEDQRHELVRSRNNDRQAMDVVVLQGEELHNCKLLKQKEKSRNQRELLVIQAIASGRKEFVIMSDEEQKINSKLLRDKL